MLDRLKVEVLCNVEDSLASCASLLKNFVSNKDFSSINQPQVSCSLTSSHSLSAMALSGSLAEIMNEETSQGRLINSLEDFYEHTQKHRARVKALGLDLYKSHPKLFEGLQEFQVEQLLEAHDQAKVHARVRASDGRPFYEVLYNDGFGHKLDRAVVDSLNAHDKKIMERVQEKLGLRNRPDLLAKAERIEKIADLVDRGMSPVSTEEFGRTIQKGSSFMVNAEDRELARFLENKYAHVTKGLEFKPLTSFKSSAVTTRLYLNKRFSSALIRYGAEPLSSRSLTGAALRGFRKVGNVISKAISSKGFAVAMKLSNGPMLYLSEIKSTACSELGYHDWVKDPNCSPAIGLTPRVIEFLNEDWEMQKMYLKSDKHTCEVIQKTYDQSILAPKLTACSAQSVEFKNNNGDKIEARFDTEKNMTEVIIKKSNLLNKLYPLGALRAVKIKPDGSIDTSADVSAFVHAMNYQIQQAIHCCQPINGFLETRCQK